MQNIHLIKIAYLVPVIKLSGNLPINYHCVKMMSLDQKHKTVIKVANIGVSKLRISLKDIKS